MADIGGLESLETSILALWHTYRISCLAVFCATVALGRLYVWWISKKSRVLQSSSPQLGPLVDKKWAKENETQIFDETEEKVKVEDTRIGAPIKTPIAERSVPRSRPAPKRVKGSKSRKLSPPKTNGEDAQTLEIKPLVFFSSLMGTTEAHAKGLIKDMEAGSLKDNASILEPELHDLSYIDYEDFFVSIPKSQSENVRYFYMLVVPSFNIDTTLDTFIEHLQETHHDFRIDTGPLSALAGYSVFGFGDKEGWPTEAEGFCSQAREVDKWMAKLTARKRAFPLGLGDVKSDAKARIQEWRIGVEETLRTIASDGFLGEGVKGSGNAVESDEEEDEEYEESEGESEGTGKKPTTRRKKNEASLGDVEDLGGKIPLEESAQSTRDSVSPLPIDFTTSSKSTSVPASVPTLKAMVPKTSPTYAALTKQGYSIIGSHSGVKICRWTKSALRGRGSCYKYSFYGIASHLCMETTPSLSCSNKCVFCWRHGTNPVGTTWRWQVDPPDLIFEGARAAHIKKIKMMRGVPGVRAERFQEAMRIRHCALSLVGEPIFYPHINEFVDLLHKDHISSFLVCNAQHPDQLAALKPVTQLYVSIDASNKEELRRVDRPLHRDFWERFQKCLDILATRRRNMRTVFRLTLVKGFNLDEEAEGYAELVARGRPCFVEIKGVTYCGTSTSNAAGLTMQNVPFWAEVQAFVVALHAALRKRGLKYGIAAEHAHSCCALLADDNFKRNGKWCTVIDYEKFFELLESGREFGPEEYMGAETPDWALWGKGGFDPRDERVDRKGRPLVIADKEAEGESGGCG